MCTCNKSLYMCVCIREFMMYIWADLLIWHVQISVFVTAISDPLKFSFFCFPFLFLVRSMEGGENTIKEAVKWSSYSDENMSLHKITLFFLFFLLQETLKTCKGPLQPSPNSLPNTHLIWGCLSKTTL